MTNEEARRIRSAFCNGVEYPFGGGFIEKCDMDEINRHAELLDEALKKQIPKKPIKSDREIRYCEIWECPACRFEFSGRVSSYCYRCGQALDWGDTMSDTDRCVCCGEIIPEGRQVCPRCEGRVENAEANRSASKTRKDDAK